MKSTREKISPRRIALLGTCPARATGFRPMELTGHDLPPRPKSRLRQACLRFHTAMAPEPPAPPAGRSATPILRPAAGFCVNTAQSKSSAPPILPPAAGNLSPAADNLPPAAAILRSTPPEQVHDPAFLPPAPAADPSLAAANHSPAAAEACRPVSRPRLAFAVAKFPSTTLNSTSASQSPVTTHTR